jgi:glycosyltransferase involved in cell wall biosynthesis
MTNLIVVIPALNEEDSIGEVLRHVPPHLVSHVIVCDNASTDRTAEVAAAHGAIVVRESERGYGAACLRALEEAHKYAPDVIVFIDADYSDFPEEMSLLVAPILDETADMVIGSRSLGDRLGKVEKGAFLPQARFGNWLATTLIRLIWGVRFSDLGPFRAIRWNALERLQMRDRNFGWTVEMQIKAAQHHLRCTEIPVSYRARIGHSKITGTIKGTILAGYKILWTIARYSILQR